jgi:hypothetical protein
MEKKLEIYGRKLFNIYLSLGLVWVFCALSTQVFFIYLELSGQSERTREIVNKVEVKIDGRYSDNPNNIWYEGDKK